MIDSNTLDLKVLITPLLDDAKDELKVTSLSITLTFGLSGIGTPAGEIIASHHTPLEPIEVSDEIGKVKTSWVEENESLWNLVVDPEADRATEGVLVIQYHVQPMSPSEKSSVAYRETQLQRALLAEQGGLIGPGSAFLLMPPAQYVSCRQVVEWDLSSIPEGIRAVSSLGEGPDARDLVGDDGSTLLDLVYMVGDVQSHATGDETYGYYWFGTLPANIEKIKDIHPAFIKKVASFFSDPLTAARPYRTFIRNIAPASGIGNTPLLRSNIFSYDDRITTAQDYDLVRCMAHEVIHNFLGPLPNVSHQMENWLYQGIANALSIYFPFRPPIQFRDGKYFQATLNMLCMKYYTSPLLNSSFSELLEQAESDDYAREQLYVRAWAFVVCTDFRARDLAGGIVDGVVQRPVEDLAIKVLAKYRIHRRPYGLQQWFGLLQPLMGNEPAELYEKMCRGDMFIFPEKAFGARTHKMVESPREILDFGLNRRSFEDGVVMGLKKGSRAQEAGLCEGDVIIGNSYPWRCVDDFNAKMKLSVQRKGEEEVRRIEYWPRSYEKARCWQLTEVTKIAIV